MQYSANTSARVRPIQFRLRSLLLLTTWMAVCLGLARTLPVLGIVALALTLPAIAKTWSDLSRSGAGGARTSILQVIQSFLWSLVVLVAIAVVWVAMVLGAVFSAILLVVIAGTWFCRFAAIPMAQFGQAAGGTPRYIVRTALRHMNSMSGGFRRRPRLLPRWIVVSATLLSMLIYACIAAGLVSLALLVVGFGHASRQSARLYEGCRRLKGKVAAGMPSVEAWKALRRAA